MSDGNLDWILPSDEGFELDTVLANLNDRILSDPSTFEMFGVSHPQIDAHAVKAAKQYTSTMSLPDRLDIERWKFMYMTGFMVGYRWREKRGE
jgi:hypothetical protein